ncbi:MAG: LptF/LptG family permease [Planctomycetota bacterium]|nr:LptF/LptG family permease [Planctomycetota bacterium]
MKILDRYIVRSFLFTVLLFFLVMMSLRITVDLFLNMDEFTKKVSKTVAVEVDGKLTHVIKKRDPKFAEIVTNVVGYYSYQSLMYFTELGGVIIVASAAFSLARMNHTNELTAMLAAGVSLHRVIWPIILCAMLLGGLVILDQEAVIPQVADKLVRSRDDVPGTEEFAVYGTTDGGGSAWYAEMFFPATSVLRRPVVMVRDESYRLLASIPGSQARPAKVRGQSGWILSDAVLARTAWAGKPRRHVSGTERVWTQIGPKTLLRRTGVGLEASAQITCIREVRAEDVPAGLLIEAERFVPERSEDGRIIGGVLEKPRFTFTSETNQPLGSFLAAEARWSSDQDAAGAEGNWRLSGGEMFYPSDLTIDDLILRRDIRWLDFMSSSQLNRLLQLDQVSNRDAALLTKHLRVTSPINNLVMLLLGLPFILSRQRNIKASAALCLLMVAAFYAFIYICRYVELGPTLSAWLPVLLFGPVAAVMLDSIKT